MQSHVNCHLWNPPPHRRAVLAALEIAETYLYEYHETKTLMRCKACGQLYFSEWRETISFRDDSDQQDEVLIPVADAETGLVLSKLSRMERLRFPILVLIWPPADAKPYWINR